MVFVVTGSTGFIGQEFVSFALRNGHIVYAVGRNEEKMKRLFHESDNLHFVITELSEFKSLDNIITRADIFVNFAWDGITVSGRDMKIVQELNTQYTKEALMAAQRMGCKVFVESGSQAEYGIVYGKITEETTCYPYSEYGKAKLQVLRDCENLCRQIGIKYLHLRIFSVFGKGDHGHTLINTTIPKLLRNDPVELSPCKQKWNFLYVKDAVKQILLLSEYAYMNEDYVSEIYNVASDDTRCLQSFVFELKGILSSKSDLLFGAINPVRFVSINPDINKLKNAINFVSDYCFRDAILEMVKE